MDKRISRDGEEGAGPSCKLQAPSLKQEKIQASSFKLQAPSEYKKFRQDSSPKHQASSSKPRPESSMMHDPRNM